MNVIAIRWCYVILGLIGLPPAALALVVNYDTLREARRKNERRMGLLFFIFSMAMAVLLAGNAGIALWLLLTCAEMTLWPAVAQIMTMLMVDVGLIGMCVLSIQMDRERKGKTR